MSERMVRVTNPHTGESVIIPLRRAAEILASEDGTDPAVMEEYIELWDRMEMADGSVLSRLSDEQRAARKG